ncbi:MAG: restriction endonuclease subunit S [Candidatus Magasanikbacteria bacterium]
MTKNNWQTKKLSEVCDFQNGFAFKSKLFKENGFPVLRISNIQNDGISYNRLVFFDKKSYKENFDKYQVLKGDLVIAMSGATTGKLAVCDTDEIFYLNQRVGKFKPKKDLVKDYLYYFLSTKIEENLKISMGSAQPNLSTEQIKNFEIPLPPLPTQHHIVKILDEVFAGIETAKANTEKNLKNSKEVFESYLNSVFTSQKSKVEGQKWEEKSLGDICDVEYGYTTKAKNKGKYRFVRITDTDENGLLTKENKMYVDSFKEAEKYLLNNNDLLMARTGASAGNVLLFENDEPSVFASYLIRMKFKKEIFSKLYWHFSKSKIYWDQVNQLSAGSAQPQFNGGALKQIILNYPKSLTEQKSIVAKLDALSAETKKLEEIYMKKLASLEELKKSVLKKAFAGEL